MITIIFAPPRYGKTALMTHLLNQTMFDRNRSKCMCSDISFKNQNGFCLSNPKHTVFTNYDITGRKFGYRERHSYRINPFRLGYANSKVETHFIPPFDAIGITEGQKYFNSRMSMYFPDWQSRFYEQHGHNHMDIFIDVQRPTLIDINIRELASFIEVMHLSIKHDKDHKIKSLSWTLRHIENSNLLDKYLASGKQDKSCFKQETLTIDYNIFACYDSRDCKPKFYSGHFDQDFTLHQSEQTEQTMQGYQKYLQEFDDELPQGFYAKRTRE